MLREKFINFFQDKLVPGLNKFASNTLVKAIQSGMTAPMGAMIVGSIFTLLMTPPVSGNPSGFMQMWVEWSAANASWLKLGYTFTMDSIALYSLVGLVLAICKFKKAPSSNMLILSLMAFFIICSDVIVTDAKVTTASVLFFGAKGIFSAIIIGISVVYFSMFLREKGVKIKLPSSVPPNVSEPIENLIINMIVIGVAISVRLVLANYGQSLPTLINLVFQPILSTSDTLGAVIIYVLILRGLWFFGIHGGNVTGAIMTPIFLSNMAANIDAYAQGNPIPYIFTQSFAQSLLNVGMLPLVIAMFIACRSQQLKAIGRIGLIPAIFSIGEPITFGVPIVLNFKLFIPYMFNFVFDGIAYYLLTDWGFMAKTIVNVPFTLPAPIKAYLCTLDFNAVLVWAILTALNVIIFIPFLKVYDNECLTLEKNELNGLQEA